MKIEVFSPTFKNRLASDGFCVSDIQAEAANGTIRHAYDIAHQWLDKHYPHRFLRASLYNHQRDGAIPEIYSAIEDILAPWRKTACTEFLPVVTLKEFSRRVGMHPRHIFDALKNENPRFNIGEQELVISMSDPKLPVPSKSNRRRWQRLCSERDAEFFDIKLSLVSDTGTS